MDILSRVRLVLFPYSRLGLCIRLVVYVGFNMCSPLPFHFLSHGLLALTYSTIAVALGVSRSPDAFYRPCRRSPHSFWHWLVCSLSQVCSIFTCAISRFTVRLFVMPFHKRYHNLSLVWTNLRSFCFPMITVIFKRISLVGSFLGLMGFLLDYVWVPISHFYKKIC